MIDNIKATIKGFFKKLLIPAVFIFAIGLFVNGQRKKKAQRTFTITFNNIAGLSKGAPVYAMGVKVGKVIKTFPITNSNEVGVNIFITKDNFPVPGPDAKVEVVHDIERGGARVLELTNVGDYDAYRNLDPMLQDQISRVFLEAFQLSKDFAVNAIDFLRSPQVNTYRKEMQANLQNILESAERGTLKEDAKENAQKQLDKLNQIAKKVEAGEEVLSEKDKQALMYQIESTRKTLETLVSVSDIYKDDEKKEFLGQ